MSTVEVVCPSVVSFDLWLTLLRSHREFKPRRNDLLRRALGVDVAASTFDALVRRVDSQADRRVAADLVDLGFAERADLVADEASRPRLSPGILDELIGAQAELLVRYGPRLIDDAIPHALGRLAERCTLAVTSNTGFIPGRDMRVILARLDLTPSISAFVFSDEVGAPKPSRVIYERLATLTEAAPGTILHVGDNYEADVCGAERAGLHAAWVRDDAPVLALIEALP